MLRYFFFFFLELHCTVERFIFTPLPISPPPEICRLRAVTRLLEQKLLDANLEGWTQLEEDGASELWEGQGPSFRRLTFNPFTPRMCSFFGGMISATLYFNPATLTRPAGQQPLKYNVSVVDFSFSLFWGQRWISSCVIHFGACCLTRKCKK